MASHSAQCAAGYAAGSVALKLWGILRATGLGAIESQCTDTLMTWAPSSLARASVPPGSASRRASSSMIEVCCDDATARPAGTAINTTARIAARSSATRDGRGHLIYLTV